MDLITRLKLDNSQYNSGIDSAKEKTKQFQDTAEDTNKSLNDMSQKGAKSAKELLSEMNKLENAGRSASNYRKQLAEIQKQIVDLTQGYRNMSSEMQNSALGKEVAGKIQELTQQAAQYKDTILDVSQEIKNLASDTAVWDGMKQGIDTASAALQGFVAMGVLGEKSQEKLVAVIAKLKSIEAATNAVIKVGNALQKNSNVLTSIRTLQTKALTKAKDLETAATGRATIAQKLFNAVAKANPYVLLAAAILGVVTAIGAFTLATKKHNTEAEKAKRIQEGYNKALSDGKLQAAESIAKFNLLRTQYSELRTEGEKTQWIEDNKSKFSELGVELNNIADAQKWLIDNAEDFIRALTLEAEAQALMDYYVDEYKKGIEEMVKAQDKASNAGSDFWGLTAREINKYGLEEGKHYTKEVIPGATSPTGITTPPQTIYHLTADGQAKLEEEGKKSGEAIVDGVEEGLSPVMKMASDKLTQAASLRKGSTPTPKNNNNNNNKGSGKTPEELELERQEKLLKQLHDEQMKLMELKAQMWKVDKNDAEAVESISNNIEAQESVISTIKQEITDKGKIINSELKLWKDYRAELEKQKENIIDGSDEWKKQIEILSNVEKKIKDLEGAAEAYRKRLEHPLEPIELPVNPILGKVETKEKLEVPLTIEDKRGLYADAKEAAAKIQEYFDLGLMSKEQAQSIVDNINQTLAKEDIKATVSLEINDKSIQNITKAVSGIDSFTGIANGFVGSFNDVYESLSSLGEKLSEETDGWKRFFLVFQTGMTILSSVATVIETVAKVQKLLNTEKNKGAVASLEEAGATETETQAHLKNAGAKASEAIAGASKSASEIPIVGWVLAGVAALTLLGTLIGAMTKAKGFATGGIVPGNSMHGDKIMAGLNSGEMVLNTQQQKNLFKMLNEGRTESSTGGQVEFKIRGTELVGVLNNQNKKNSKI